MIEKKRPFWGLPSDIVLRMLKGNVDEATQRIIDEAKARNGVAPKDSGDSGLKTNT
jgi:hypothetical protein